MTVPALRGGVPRIYYINGVLIVAVLIGFVLSRLGRPTAAAIVVVVAGLMTMAVAAYTGGGITSFPFTAMVVLIVMAGVFVGRIATLITWGAIFLAGIAMAVAEQTGRLPVSTLHRSVIGTFVVLLVVFGLVAMIIYFARDTIEKNLERAQREFKEKQISLEALVRSERLLTEILDALPPVVYVKGLDGVYLLVNRTFENLFNIRREDARSMTSFGIHPKEVAARLSRNDHEVAVTGRALEIEEVLSIGQESRTFMSVKFPIHGPNGEVTAVGGVSTDITELKYKEGELRAGQTMLEDLVRRRTAELKKTNASLVAEVQRREQVERELRNTNADLDMFVQTASHDLRSPLRAIAGMGTVLVEDFAAQLGDEGMQSVNSIRSASVRMAKLLDDLLLVSRFGSGELHRESVDLNIAVREVLDGLDREIAASKARISVSSGLPTVFGCRSVLNQMLQNLVENAIKFVVPGCAPEISIYGAGRDGWCELAIADQGIGIDEQHRERIFQPFERVDGAGEFSGTGLGLAIVRKAVNLHGGTITVESTPGKGSTFRVRLRATPMRGPSNGVSSSK
jgi:PAS domain S-box-containing protein